MPYWKPSFERGEMDYLETGSVVLFIAAALITLAGSLHERRNVARLDAMRTEFLAQAIIERGHLFTSLDNEEAITKLARVMEDVDQEWHARYEEDLKPDKIEIISSYLGNVSTRSSHV